MTTRSTSALGAVVIYVPATATDVSGPTSIFYSTASGSLFAMGTTVVTVTAFSASLNFATLSFLVVVS
jgi:large repetitive protein